MKKCLLMLFLITLANCTKNNNLSEINILKIAVPTEARGLYPYTANDPHSARVYSQIFDTLLTKDSNGNVIPSLATEWKFVTPTVFELTINTNIQFHNQEYLTIDDVQFSFEEILKTPNLAHTVNSIKETKIVDVDTIQIILKEPYVAIKNLLTIETLTIVNKKSILEMKDNSSIQPIGTGAYKLKSWDRGEKIVLEKFENSWKKTFNVDQAEFITVSDASARAIAIESGDVHIAFDIESGDRERISLNNSLILKEKSIPRVEYIAMNICKGNNPLWKSKEGRQLLEHAIDKKNIVKYVLFDTAEVANSLVPPAVLGYDKNVPYREFDINKSKELLTSLNIENPSVSILTREGVSQKIAEVIQSSLLEVGIETKIEVAEYARFLEMIANGEHDIFILNWSTITGDPDYAVNNLINSQSWGAKGNRSFYKNENIDQLLYKAKIEQDNNERMGLYKTIQQNIYSETPYIPLFYPIVNVATQANIENVELDMLAQIALDKISIK